MATTIRVGTSSWTDKTLIDSGKFYPKDVAKDPKKRLEYYASQFNVVEVDSTYYGMPSEQNAALWVERTPQDFQFHVKAFGLFTGHPVQARGLPKDIREDLPADVASKRSVYLKDLDGDAVEAIWERFESALLPLDSAGKLAAVAFQFPFWFSPKHENRQTILECRRRLPQYRISVEFRNGLWLNERNLGHTLEFLREQQIALVCVDEPQGIPHTVPPVAEATSAELAVVRFHGRNKETWNMKGITAAARFNYLYGDDELGEWKPRIERLAGQTAEVHAMMNNCHEDKAVRNAYQLQTLLQ